MTDTEKDNNIKDNNMGQEIDSRFLEFAFLKSKKLVQATYLVTSFIPDSEPLKWRLREAVLELMSDTNLLVPTSGLSDSLGEGQISPLFKISVLEAVLNHLDQVMNLVDVASAAGFASEMNLAILKNEFQNLSKSISVKLGRGLREIVGPGEASQLLLEAREKYPVSNPSATLTQNLSETNYNTNVRLSEKLSEKFKETKTLKDKDLYPKEETKKIRRLSNKDARRLEIITFLKGKSWSSIKDISDAIPDCSTKTIQRELSDLVQKGVLKKKGDRRWSRYLLA